MVMIKMATYEETMEALEGAIKKWEKIYAGVGIDEGVDNCPLCELFDDAYDCIGCPVDYVTNEGCQGGPYSDWYWHHRFSHDSANHPFIIECAKCTEIALSMVNYLKSLRPKVDEMFCK